MLCASLRAGTIAVTLVCAGARRSRRARGIMCQSQTAAVAAATSDTAATVSTKSSEARHLASPRLGCAPFEAWSIALFRLVRVLVFVLVVALVQILVLVISAYAQVSIVFLVERRM